jgi:telomere length regulation protein
MSPHVTMEGLLTPVGISYKNSGEIGDDAFIEIPKPYKPAPKASAQASSPAEALEILRSEPDHDTLLSTLKFLGKEQSDFSITSPSPIAAQLVYVLVSDTVPTYWNVLQELSRRKKAAKQESSLEILLSCLRSVTGLNAVVLSLKQHIQLSKETQKAVGGPNIQSILVILLQLLQSLLGYNQTVEAIWKNIHHSSNIPANQKAIWNKFLGLIGNGKILGVAAEAEDIINHLSKKVGERYWIADATLYCLWLTRNVTHWSRNLSADSEIEIKGCGELLSKSFRLGYTGMINSTCEPEPKLTVC